MKLFRSTILFLLAISFFACEKDQTKEQPKNNDAAELTAVAYDSVLARSYGADDYGMKTYVMAFLKRGPDRGERDA